MFVQQIQHRAWWFLRMTTWFLPAITWSCTTKYTHVKVLAKVLQEFMFQSNFSKQKKPRSRPKVCQIFLCLDTRWSHRDIFLAESQCIRTHHFYQLQYESVCKCVHYNLSGITNRWVGIWYKLIWLRNLYYVTSFKMTCGCWGSIQLFE